MELISGPTLRQRMPENGMSVEEAWAILRPLMEAVAYSHGLPNPILHRDLKPENIMFTEAGRLKVLDFGLAREENGVNLTKSDQVLGTLRYMAPEQFRGEYGLAVDQYAVGVIAYELLSGKRPFSCETFEQLCIAQLTSQPTPPSQYCPLPAEIEKIILRMLETEPQDRFASVAEAGVAWKAAVKLEEVS